MAARMAEAKPEAGTSAQGQAVVEALLAPDTHGNASLYSVRALTRDPTSKSALELTARGVERVKAKARRCSFEDLDFVAHALEGAYGAWVNTDGFTWVKLKKFGMRIFEIANKAGALRHYVWSSLPCVSKYKVDHMDAKARVADWLRVQPSVASEDHSPGGLFDPLNLRADGTVVFAAPVAGGQIPMIALKDLGCITSERVGWEYLVETFKKVTDTPQAAVFKPQSLDEWWSNFDDRVDGPVASEKKPVDGSRTIRDNFSAFWCVLRDDVVQKDMDWIRQVHPGIYTLERWMRETNYGGRSGAVLKNSQEGRGMRGLNDEVAKLL
ncbi:NAD-P-binding protein [Mycena leptocephala]|nr:NAD-P-binding protein [Mycena leptocephala]